MQKGKVIFIGAGPGDPELLTLKALRYLKIADVVLVDRLVSEVILKEYVNPSAEIMFVGKECGASKSFGQDEINGLLLRSSYKGKLIIRLKGGDVSIFSNIYDELRTLNEFEVPYEIIPGITAALGAAAYSGIPLTARGFASAVRFLTYYKHEEKSDRYWFELANTEDTLVFYMSGKGLPGLIKRLNENGVSKDKTIAVIEQATTPYQRVFTYTFDQFSKGGNYIEYVSPSLIIIGRVGSLHQEFAWLGNSEQTKNYFKSLSAEERQVTYQLNDSNI